MKLVKLMIAILAVPIWVHSAAEDIKRHHVDKDQISERVLTILGREILADADIVNAFSLIEQLKTNYGSTEAGLLKILFDAIMAQDQLSGTADAVAQKIILRFQEKLGDPAVKVRREEYERLLDQYQMRLLEKRSLQKNEKELLREALAVLQFEIEGVEFARDYLRDKMFLERAIAINKMLQEKKNMLTVEIEKLSQQGLQLWRERVNRAISELKHTYQELKELGEQ